MGDNAYDKGNYASAVYFYKKTIEGSSGGKYDVTFPYEINSFVSTYKTNKDTTREYLTPEELEQQYVVNKLADSYRLLNDYETAELWYERAIANKSEDFKYVKYWYGTILMNLEKYEKAQKQFDDFETNHPDQLDPFVQLATNKEVSCQYALNPENTKDGIEVNYMDSIFNKGSSSFGISYYEGESSLVFTSARRGNNTGDLKDNDGYYFADLFVTNDFGDGFQAPERMQMPINSGMHEGSCAISTDRTIMYFTRWNNDDKTDCHIYVVKKFNNQWMQPLKLNTVNIDGYRSMNPHLSFDETKLYFVSDMPGGKGGLDIWYCPVDDNANLGTPINLGPVINTPEDEQTPYYHFQSSTLFFSSEGHIGYGGQDIFKTKYNEDDETWSNPINVGAPLNSSKDDLYYILDHNQKFGYMTSDREKCADCDTTPEIKGHCHKLYKIEKPKLEFSISGYVFNSETDEPIANALITVKDIKGNWTPFFIMTDGEGYYEKELGPNMDMFMKAQKAGFFGDAATVSTSGLTESTALEQDFFLNPIPDQAINIEGIEYDYDKATLRPKSKEILDKLTEFLKLNDNLVIEIQSHTDFRGEDDYNLDLSNRRAQSVVDYLVDAGIPRVRMQPKGYGETTPAIALDENGNPLKDANGEFITLDFNYINTLTNDEAKNTAHQRNRRTAFKVLSSDNEVIQESNNQ